LKMNILLINHYAGSIQHGMEYRPYSVDENFGNEAAFESAG